jgi:hypothetical protein
VSREPSRLRSSRAFRVAGTYTGGLALIVLAIAVFIVAIGNWRLGLLLAAGAVAGFAARLNQLD